MGSERELFLRDNQTQLQNISALSFCEQVQEAGTFKLYLHSACFRNSLRKTEFPVLRFLLATETRDGWWIINLLNQKRGLD
jgi:hypothetical protein